MERVASSKPRIGRSLGRVVALSIRQVSITKAEAKVLIQRRAALKDVRQDALRAFGFERDLTQTAPLLDPPRIVNERTLHMDKITAKLKSDIPGFLKRYFN